MRALYDSKSKLDDRGIKLHLTEKSKVESWLKVEAALAQSQSEFEFIPKSAAQNIVENCKIENIDFEEMAKIKERVGHGFVPFLKVLVNACSEEGGKFVHYGVTTQNIQQTAQLYQLRKINGIIHTFLKDILINLAKIADDNANTVLPGRTHGKHAIPITFGYKASVWISELLANIERMEESEKRIFQVMMGGAVGGFNAINKNGREIQDAVADKLNMGSMDVPSRNMCQHKEEYIMNLAMLCNSFHKIAEETYYCGIEEIGEVAEGFEEGTIGSSTMPHKINPKLSKGIIANSQKIYSLISVGLYSSVRMFEGDSSSYMLFDGLLEEAIELTAEVIVRAEELTRTLHVNEEKMLSNAWINQGLDNTENVMMHVAEKIGKDKAHELLYDIAMQTELAGVPYLEALMSNEIIVKNFSEEDIKMMIDPSNYIGQCPVIAREMAKKAKEKAGNM